MKKKYIQFYVGALLFSWLAWAPYGASIAGLIDIIIPWEAVLIGQFGPSLMAIVFVFEGSQRIGLKRFLQKSFRLNAHWKYYMVAIFSAPTIALLLICIYKIYGFESPGIQELAGWPELYALDYGSGGPYTISGELVPNLGFVAWVKGLINKGSIYALTIFVLLAIITGPLSEELGWRGYLLPGLLEKWHPLKCSLIIGILWGWWHTGPDFWQLIFEGKITAFLYPAAITLGTLPLSVLFTWLFLKGRASLIPIMLFHASFNSTLYK